MHLTAGLRRTPEALLSRTAAQGALPLRSRRPCPAGRRPEQAGGARLGLFQTARPGSQRGGREPGAGGAGKARAARVGAEPVCESQWRVPQPAATLPPRPVARPRPQGSRLGKPRAPGAYSRLFPRLPGSGDALSAALQPRR